MNSDNSNSIQPEDDRGNQDPDPTKCISDETNAVDKDLFNLNENTQSDGCASTENDERNKGNTFQNASDTQLSGCETQPSTNPAIKKSKAQITSEITVKQSKEKINDEEYDEDNDGIVETNGQGPGEDNLYDDDDQIGLSGDCIQKKNMNNLISNKGKMMKFQIGTKSKMNQLKDKTKKNEPFDKCGKSVPLLKLFKDKDKNLKGTIEESKSKSANIHKGALLNDDIYDEDGVQVENERINIPDKKDKRQYKNITERTQIDTSKNSLDEEYDEDDAHEPLQSNDEIPQNQIIENHVNIDKISPFKLSKYFTKKLKNQNKKVKTSKNILDKDEYDVDDSGTSEENPKYPTEPKVIANNADYYKISLFKSLNFFNKKPQGHNMKDRTTNSVSNEEYDGDDDIGLSDENVKIPNSRFNKNTNVTETRDFSKKISPFKSSKVLENSSKGHDTNLNLNLKPLKRKIVKEKEDEDLYDEDKQDSIVISDSSEVLLDDQRILNESNDLYDEDENCQVNTRVVDKKHHICHNRSLDSTGDIYKKSSKLESSKNYINQQIKNLKTKEKYISHYLKRKIQMVKLFSTSSIEDKVEELCEDDWNEVGDNELEDLYDDDANFEPPSSNSNDVCDFENTTGGTDTTHDRCPARVDKKVGNFKTKDRKKNQFFSKRLDIHVTSNDDDITPLRERNTNEDNDENGNEFERKGLTNESENLISNNSCYDDHSTEGVKVTDGPSKLEHMTQFFNEKITKVKKSKKAISKRLNERIQIMKRISTNHRTSDKDKNDEEYAGDSSDSEKNLKNSSHAESIDRYGNRIEEEKIRNITNDINVRDNKSLGVLKCPCETSIKKKKTDNISSFKLNPSRSFTKKWNTFDTKRKKFSKIFQLKIKKKNRKGRKIEADMYDEDNFGIHDTINYSEEYCDETEDEEKDEKGKYRKDSQATKSCDSDDVLIQRKNYMNRKLSKQMKIMRMLKLGSQRVKENNSSKKEHNDSETIENSEFLSVDKCKNKNLTKPNGKVKHIWKVKRKPEGLNMKSPNSKWYFEEEYSQESLDHNKETGSLNVDGLYLVNKEDVDVCKNKELIDENKRIRKRETEGENIFNDSNTGFGRQIKTSKFRKNEDIHDEDFDYVHFKNKLPGSDSSCFKANEVNTSQNIEDCSLCRSISQNSNQQRITTHSEDNLDDFLNKKIQSLFETWIEKAGPPRTSNHVVSPVSKRTEKNMKIEVLNEEIKDPKASNVTLTRSDSFPLIKRRYNLPMCLEYFDKSREIVDISTEILQNGQQVVHITLGEGGRNLIFERDIEQILRTNTKVKKSSRNDLNSCNKLNSENKSQDKGKNEFFNGQFNKRRIRNSKEISPDSKDEIETSKQLSSKTYKNNAVCSLKSPPIIPRQNKLSERDIYSKQARKMESHFECDPEFEKDQNTLILRKTFDQ